MGSQSKGCRIRLPQRPDIFQVPDFQFLLEAVKCESEGRSELCKALSSLYFLARRIHVLKEANRPGFLRDILKEDAKNDKDPTFQLLLDAIQSMCKRHGKKARSY